MRKIPIIDNIMFWSMQFQIILILLVYFAYDFSDEIGTVISYSVYAVFILSIVGIMRYTMKNTMAVRVGPSISDNRIKSLRSRMGVLILIQIIITGAIALHFWLYNYYSRDFMPLYKEYGIGLVLGIVLNYLNFFKWSAHVTDKGIMIGSIIDKKLILWDDVHEISESNENIIIQYKTKFPIKSLILEKTTNTRSILAMKEDIKKARTRRA